MSRIPLGILASSLPSGGNALTLISTQILTSTATSIDFTSIPGTYKHLQLRVAARDNGGAGSILMRFNSDTASNYSYHYLATNGSTLTSYGNSTTYMQTTLYYWGVNATFPTAQVHDILDYASTSKYKTLRTLSGQAGTSANELSLSSGSWRNTAAITSITLLGSTFKVGDRFSLYGVS